MRITPVFIKIGLLSFVLMALPSFAESFAGTPEGVVKSFIADYAVWNDKASARDKKPGPAKGTEQAEREYGELMKKYCPPGFKHEPIAYSDYADHSVADEVIVSVETKQNRSLVKTRNTSHKHGKPFVSNYEYQLTRDAVKKRWYLISVQYVNETGKYEGL